MRLLAYWMKTFKENLREWKILILAFIFGPFFVYMMYAYFIAATPSYALLVINGDRPVMDAAGRELRAGDDLAAGWAAAKYPDGKAIFKIRPMTDLEDAKTLLKNRDADLLIVIPADLSRSIEDFKLKKSAAVSPLKTYGDQASVRFTVAAAFADYASYAYLGSILGQSLPSLVEFEVVSAGRPLSDFDLYVPALLVLAVIMVLFTAAASLIKEVDKGTITRLKISRLTLAEFVGAISLNQLLIGLAALGLTFLAAVSVGYAGGGSVAAFILTGAVSILSVVAISLLVAGWMRTIYELLTVGVFPFFVLMFFSESMFPLPRLALFRIAGRYLYVNDILPTALTVKAFNKILNFGAGLGDIAFELAAMSILTAGYFAAGVWLFRKRHLAR